MNEERVFLVIDDNTIDQLIAKTLLMKCLDASESHGALSGVDGIEWIKHNRLQLNKQLIILLDMQMPVLDGFGFLDLYGELSEELKADTEILMLSSTADNDRAKAARNHKYVKALLSKPLNIEELKEVI